jgi:hypothetical protein
VSEPSSLAQSKRPAMRVQKSLAFVQRVRIVLYALLVASALLSFWAGGVQGSSMPIWTPIVAPALFGAFLLIFAVYRLSLIRARHYPASTGLFQIGLGALVFVLLLPGSRHALSDRVRASGNSDEILAVINSADPRVRSVATELAGTRPPGPTYVPALNKRLDDPDPRVRKLARNSLDALLGAAPQEDPSEEAGNKRLRSALIARGWLTPAP